MSCVSLDEIKTVLEDSKIVTWEHVYDMYEGQERPKWLRMHKEPMTSRHFDAAKLFFSKKVWHEGLVSIGKLYPINLCINTPWIQELACPNHLQSNCPHCSNPTLEQLVKNISLNPSSVWYPKIASIQEEYIHGELHNPFVILVDNKPPYVWDGNSRLMSIASLPDTQECKIKCFLGFDV